MGQFRFILWLAYWYLQNVKFEFEWDSGNSNKSFVKHGVEITEVESVFLMRLGAPIGQQFSPAVEEQRLCLVGPSERGRILAIVFTIRDGRVRPISSRLANRKERQLYEKVRKEVETI
jgi:uncharacterized DUF497 family protein